MTILIEQYDRGEIDELRIVYTRFINTLSREPLEQKLLPVELNDFKRGRPTNTLDEEYDRSFILYDPSPKEVLNALIPQLLIGYVYGAIVHAYASENCSRMAAMENATRSADKMIEKLTQQYHAVRQLTITNELADIIGAANAANAAAIRGRRLLSGGESRMTEQERTGSIIRIIGPVLGRALQRRQRTADQGRCL